jgi:hypothetical protein
MGLHIYLCVHLFSEGAAEVERERERERETGIFQFRSILISDV